MAKTGQKNTISQPLVPPLYDEGDLVMISALQHYLFCPRQCALIHQEQIWSENVFTAEGRLLHNKSDSGQMERRGNVKTVTALLLRSLRYGLTGKADVVEFHQQADGLWLPFPVEYKRGQPKVGDADQAQLCAQALCLEEMLHLNIPAGALFYGKTRRRKQVIFSGALRGKTIATAQAVHTLLAQNHPPPPVNDARCEHCSLREQCLPQETVAAARASRYLEALQTES
jgi:CRISPR-associated exonuclease Cas4